MKKIALIGAFDRYNYGDVFMPIVFQEINKKQEYSYELFGTRKIDMSFCGGYSCDDLSTFYKKYNTFDAVVVVGGQCLGCSYGNAWLSTLDESYDVSSFGFQNSGSISDFAKKQIGGESPAPWVVNVKNSMPVIYNTVGGNMMICSLRNDMSIKEYFSCWNNLNKASYLAVRDEYTYKINKIVLHKMRLYPDSVTLLSEIYSSNNTDFVSNQVRRFVAKTKKYIVFQVNEAIGSGNESAYAKEIDKIYEIFGIRTVLLPLGNIYGHGDKTILKNVFKYIKNKDSCIMFDFLSIYDDAHIIANAFGYVGSSLHGMITSISYAIPHIAISTGAKKAIRYIDTWKTSKRPCLTEKNWGEELITFFKDDENREMLKRISKKLINKAYENNYNIVNIIG